MLSLSLPCDYQKRGLMGELDGLDLEGAKKLQDASDEVIAQIREDFLAEDADTVEAGYSSSSSEVRAVVQWVY
ncbi:predicted protein [Botrytis cinerea T4]|uniref:Uncharacterized protein n=1 Tax=Botryotinia fuckeliana (strain T4) TaxID=999810 RepID=G2YS98_BOTF4|nr:predicted protein [Botrytis cinerea T4]